MIPSAPFGRPRFTELERQMAEEEAQDPDFRAAEWLLDAREA